QIAVMRQTNMAGIELARRIEQVSIDALVRQRACRKRRDELLRSFCQHAADVNVPLLEPPDQIQCLVSGDAAADDQGDARLIGCRGVPDMARMSVCRLWNGLLMRFGEIGAAL